MTDAEKYAIELMILLESRPKSMIEVNNLYKRCGSISWAKAYTVNRGLVAFGWIGLKRKNGKVYLHRTERTANAVLLMGSS